MKYNLLACLPLLCTASTLHAVPICTNGTFADYIALGATGCTIGEQTVSDPVVLSTSGDGAAAPAARRVVVAPLPCASSDSGILLSSGAWSAFVGRYSDSTICLSASATGPSMNDARLSLSGGTIGLVCGLMNGTLGSPANLGMLGFVPGHPSSHVDFVPVQRVDVLKDIKVVSAPEDADFATFSVVERRF